MKRNLEALGSAIMVMFAMGALASAAQAEFFSEAEETVIDGVQEGLHHFDTGTLEVTCTTAVLKGQQSGESSETLTVSPTHLACHMIMLFTFSATVHRNSCDYVLWDNGDLEVDCGEPNDAIEIASSACTINIPPQILEGAVYYENVEGEIVASVEAEHIWYEYSGPSCGEGEDEDGVYWGDWILTGTDAGSGEPTNIWWE
jgi:hypothetical protein